MAIALNLGTVVTAGNSSDLNIIGLPQNEIAKIVMPLGHPTKPYTFVNRPLVLSSLPRIKSSTISLSTVLNKTIQHTTFGGQLTKEQQSQMLWASYGYSYYLDNSDQANNPVKRHRTVPSAHGYYPLRMYMVTSLGVFRYIPGAYNPLYGLLRGIWRLPVISELRKVNSGDHRSEIAQATGQDISSAPMFIVSVLDKKQTNRPYDDVSGNQDLWLWYYEAGASAQNILLEATAWNLSANLYTPTNLATVRTVLNVNENFTPLFIIPVGK
jgi:nitroreductase